MTDIVVLSLESWDAVWRRNQHVVAGLLRVDPHVRVLFVEPSTDPLHDLTRRHLPRRGRGLRRGPELSGVARDRLWLYEPTKHLPRRVDPHVDERWAEAVEHAAERLGFIEPVLWVNDPTGAHVLARTGWPALYDITDDWLAADRPEAELARLRAHEDLLFERAEEVVVCSPGLAERKGALREVTLVPNAVDVDAYRQPAPRPVDLPDRPVALYVGTVHTDRIDIDLCAATARGLDEDDAALVLVGPAPLTPHDRARLTTAGTVLLGPRHRDTIPGYLQHADVLVVPHVVSPFTDSLDPIKVYEYRAVGRPVVSTPVAGFRDCPEPVVLAEGSDFVDRVREAVPATRHFPDGADTEVPTWATRVHQMRAVIERLHEHHAPRR